MKAVEAMTPDNIVEITEAATFHSNMEGQFFVQLRDARPIYIKNPKPLNLIRKTQP